MRITYFIITLAICFCMSLHAENKANDYMKQAQSSLEQKDFTKARYLYLQAYKAFSNEGDYTQAIDCGTKATYLYYRENYYQEAFEPANDAVSFNRRTESAKDLLQPTFPIDKRTVADVHKTQKRGTGTASTQHIG